MSEERPQVYIWVQRIHEALQRELRRKRGEVGRVEKAMKVQPGYWRAARSRATLDAVSLLKALDILGVDPEKFFVTALGRASEAGIFEADFIRQAPAKTPKDLVGFDEDDEG